MQPSLTWPFSQRRQGVSDLGMPFPLAVFLPEQHHQRVLPVGLAGHTRVGQQCQCLALADAFRFPVQLDVARSEETAEAHQGRLRAQRFADWHLSHQGEDGAWSLTINCDGNVVTWMIRVLWGFWSWDPPYDHTMSGDQSTHHVRGLMFLLDYLARIE